MRKRGMRSFGRAIFVWVGLGVLALVSGGCGLLLGLDGYGPQACDDGVKNQGESDVDCGGSCGVCGAGKECGSESDCASLVCAAGRCADARCDDGVKNGEEAGVDCSGSCEAKCGAGEACAGGEDCTSGVCTGGSCEATCADEEKNGAETDVDCGGIACDRCELGEGCAVAGDCESGVCHAETCVSEHVWSARFGDAESQGGSSVVIDGSGHVISAGEFTGTLNLGGAPLVSTKGGTIFVAKHAAGGGHVWSKRYESDSVAPNPRIASNSSGDVVLACEAEGGIDLGGGPLGAMGSIGVFLVKLNSAGNHIWSTGFTGVGVATFYDLTADPVGNIIIAGTFTDTINFGDGTLSNVDNFEDIYVAKLDGAGKLVWSRGFASTLNVPPFRVSTDGAGNVLLTGSLRKTIDFSGNILTSAGSDDIFAVKLSASGNHVWSRRYGDGAAQHVRAIATDQMGSVFLAGGFQGSLNFGGGVLTSMGSNEIFVAKLDANGEHLWSRRFSDTGALGVSATSAAVDASGNVLISGTFNSTIDFGGGPMTSAGSSDLFITKFDGVSNHQWSKHFGDQNAQEGGAIFVDATGHLAITGGLTGSLNFGGGELISAGKADVFIAKLAYP